MATHAIAPSLPCPAVSEVPPRAERLHQRFSHCERGALCCGQCMGLLALALAGELHFDRRMVEEMSLEFFLTAMGADRERAPEAEGLRQLTADLCDVETARTEIPKLPRVHGPLYWTVMALGTFAASVLAVMLVAGVVVLIAKARG